MRIIAGTARRLPLKTPEGLDTRPTQDRIKETLFNIIAPNLPYTNFLDLFAGSGSIGLEALSRGASHCVFIENNRSAISCIKENMVFTKLEDQCELREMDVLHGLKTLQGESFDIIHMDPPYKKEYEQDVLKAITDLQLLSKDGMIIIESALDTDFSFAEGEGYIITREKCYRTNKHVFLTR